jgi:hypothetical protein
MTMIININTIFLIDNPYVKRKSMVVWGFLI